MNTDKDDPQSPPVKNDRCRSAADRVVIEHLTDIDRLMSWRREVVTEVFGTDLTETLFEENLRYYRSNILSGKHYALLACIDGTDAGCGGVCFTEELPSPDNPAGRCAYLMNIYVRRRFRGLGIGRKIVDGLVREAMQRSCGKIYLETTEMGRGLYRSAGFEDMTGYMLLGGHT